jgi:hypothetical protein
MGVMILLLFFCCSYFLEALCNLTAIIMERADRDHPTGGSRRATTQKKMICPYSIERGDRIKKGPKKKLKLKLADNLKLNRQEKKKSSLTRKA